LAAVEAAVADRAVPSAAAVLLVAVFLAVEIEAASEAVTILLLAAESRGADLARA
jgi:hypothetical protein